MDAHVRKIIHVDMDAFYASVEQRDDPGLQGRPIAVGGSRERGVVAAASYEARRFGVRSAMPSVTAARLCPRLVFVPPRFDVYQQVSREIRDVFAEHTHLVEPLSLDEAYLDVTRNLKGLPYAVQVARDIRSTILERTRLTASAGVSYNKFLAKLASDHRKPDGQFVIRPEEGAAFVENLGVESFHGIGPATAAKMNGLGIRTGLDLRERSEAFLVLHFGKAGTHFHRISRGVDDRPVVADRLRKSSGSETTFARDLWDQEEIEEALVPLGHDVWSWSERSATAGRTVTVKIKYSDFEQVTRSRTLPSPIGSRSELEELGTVLLRSVFPLRKPIRLLGISMSNFDVEHTDQPQADQPQMTFGFGF